MQKLDERGNPLSAPVTGLYEYYGPTGRLRASHRDLDSALSTYYLPYHAHERERRLSPGEIVALDIPIWPTGIRFHGGQAMKLTIAGHPLGASVSSEIPPPILVR